MENEKFISYESAVFSEAEMLERSKSFYDFMDTRRSLREFSDRPVACEIIENIIKAASTAPSGAHKQPWTFCVVSDAEIKKANRIAAEEEEFTNYHGRMSDEWLKDLTVFGTDWQKPFLETAPYLIVVFKRAYELLPDGSQRKNYYVVESVGIAIGVLLCAIQHAGLVALTHTPSPMNFLQKILKRPENERPFLLIPVGFSADNAEIPDIGRKNLEEISAWY